MFLVISPDSSFNGEFAGYKFKNGNCITELDDNLQLWFKMLGFKLKKYNEPEKKNEKPLSDAKIAEQLEKKGIRISRRTVTKYREQMQIPNTQMRKEYV